MDGILAQYIALALHGTAWLNNGSAPSGLQSDNSTFRYVAEVRFEHLGGDSVEAVDDWLTRLAGSGVAAIDLSLPVGQVGPDGGVARWRERAIFVGDDPAVGLRVQTNNGPRLWRAEWRTGNRNPLVAPPPNSKPWHITYRESLTDAELGRPALESTRQVLVDALGIAIDYAQAHKLSPSDAKLTHARELNDVDDPQPPFYADMVPVGLLSIDRRRLLAMATSAHVFGGMGTWNDIGFTDPEEESQYDMVSDRLFLAVMRSFAASVNAGSAP